MARYKPNSTIAKQVHSFTEVAKTADEKRWRIEWKGTDTNLPGIALGEADAIAEVATFKLRREAAEARDDLLETLDQLAKDGKVQADAPIGAVILAALETQADRFYAA